MKPRIKSHIYRAVSVILFSVIMSVAGCGSPKHVDKSLDDAESLMESRPHSALTILESMDMLDLKGKRERARYALLKSMALDKNYVDTTAFDILQPAIDHYHYVCLYAIGLRGKDVGAYMKMRSHVNISSAIRRKLGIDRHETNIGIYVRKLLRDL